MARFDQYKIGIMPIGLGYVNVSRDKTVPTDEGNAGDFTGGRLASVYSIEDCEAVEEMCKKFREAEEVKKHPSKEWLGKELKFVPNEKNERWEYKEAGLTLSITFIAENFDGYWSCFADVYGMTDRRGGKTEIVARRNMNEALAYTFVSLTWDGKRAHDIVMRLAAKLRLSEPHYPELELDLVREYAKGKQ